MSEGRSKKRTGWGEVKNEESEQKVIGAERQNVPYRVDGDTVSSTNGILTESVLREDGNMSLRAVYRKCLLTHGLQRLPTGECLEAQLKRHEDPFHENWGKRNPCFLNFFSFLWEEVLKAQFGENKSPTNFILFVSNTFTEEMLLFNDTSRSMTLFPDYVRRMQRTGLSFQRLDNFYEVPVILRILSPSCSTLMQSGVEDRKFFMKNCLKSVPHTLINYLWNRIYGQNEIGNELGSHDQVRGTKSEKEKKNFLIILLVLSLRFTWYMDFRRRNSRRNSLFDY